MIVIKHKGTRENFTLIPKSYICDERLSLGAKGLLTILYTLPNEWKCSSLRFAKLCNNGRRSIETLIKELESTGYLIRNLVRSEDGKHLNGYEYIVCEECVNTFCADTYGVGLIKSKEYVTLKNKSNYIDSPITSTDTNIKEDNLNYKERINKKESNKHPNEESKGETAQIMSREEQLEWAFNQFWGKYPTCKRKVNKKGCFTAFKAIKDIEHEFINILKGLELWKDSNEWSKNGGEYICAPLVFLHQERWKSILEEKKKEDQDYEDFVNGTYGEDIF